MGVVFGDKKQGHKGINAQRRDNKKLADISNKISKNELKVVFNTFYREQVSKLYSEVMRSR